MPAKIIDPWRQGDRFSASHLNQGFDVARQWSSVVGNGLSVSQTPNGTALTVNDGPGSMLIRIGVIVGYGPGSPPDPDYPDERYYVVPIFLDAKNMTDAAKPIQISEVDDENGDPVEQYPLTTTFLPETVTGAGKHQLATDGTQFVLIMTLVNAKASDDSIGGVPQNIIIPIGPGEGEGQYQFMLRMMVAQHVKGWDLNRAHAMKI